MSTYQAIGFLLLGIPTLSGLVWGYAYLLSKKETRMVTLLCLFVGFYLVLCFVLLSL